MGVLDWEEGDRFSFADSDRFEEDSMCSWSSEPESLCNNWRGWKKPSLGIGFNNKKNVEETNGVASLTELTARCVASHIPFELVEHIYPPVPEQLQLRIAFWSFPDNEEDIRLYSCLANGSADEFQRGEHLFRTRSVKDALQIGFHLSASVCQPSTTLQVRTTHNVAVTFDRRKISSCNCTCTSPAYWCSHVVAVCLYRIHMPNYVTLRAPVSESLSRLHRDQLQKFAQYLISELPQQILPTAQRLLDELLSSQPSAINSVCGAPDPTAGASVNDQTSWYLDERALHDNIKKILIKFCVPAPIVFSDVNYLSTSAPPAAAEWSSLLRPLRGREPEGMWNLLSIVREMFKRNDRNAVPLLEIVTEECMACEQILVWWFNTKVALVNGSSGHGSGGGGKHSNVNSNSHASQHACSSLCDEIVVLWRLAALNPGLAPNERDLFHNQFTNWHLKIIEKVTKSKAAATTNNHSNKSSVLRADIEVFLGFKPAIEACYLDWDDYPMPGITYTQDNNPMYHCPFTCFRHTGDTKSDTVTQVNSSQAVLNHHTHHHHHHHQFHPLLPGHSHAARLGLVDFMRYNMPNGTRSSVSSEGFCEIEDEANILVGQSARSGDSDSQEGGGSDAASNSGASSAAQSTQRSVGGNQESKQKSTGKTATVNKKSPETESDASPSEDVKECSRRPSKDESLSSSNSESPQSGDEYNVYYYDPKASVNDEMDKEGKEHKLIEESPEKTDVFANIKRTDDPWDVLFARAEGLYAHGHGKEACLLGIRLAEELLANPPNLMIDIPPLPKRKGKKQQVNPASHQLTCLASATLSKCAFICTVLAENADYSHLAFRVGLFALEMPRPPASTKPLEVKLANQEADIVALLKRLHLGPEELKVIRNRAEQLRDGTLKSRGEAMLPIMLASFIFDSLMTPTKCDIRNKMFDTNGRYVTDEALCFEAAVAALGLKANVSEADHPLLCEGTRRQRGELAVTLLVHYKDDPCKIAKIMEKLLDREVHTLIKGPLLSSYYSNNPPIRSQLIGRRRGEGEPIPSALPFKPPCDPISPCDPIIGFPSRPHSSTSAELDQNMAGLSITNPTLPSTSQTPVLQAGQSRTKESRYKGKRAYPSIPNQPSEAGAHFMIELAKTVLTKAGGTSSTSLFTQASTSQNHLGPHRGLHMCAFQLGLYALGLHNCVSPNWLSRTYSSHVSWITGQAMEIGAPAISFLIDTWEGHLTPPEAVSIADRASRGCDANMSRAAADLALSCLPHAHALNPGEINRAILQCKEQSDVMLEYSCLTVENAAKGGGINPEVLFNVARYWYDLYKSHTPPGELLIDEEIHDPLQLDTNNPMMGIMEQSNQPPPMEMMPQIQPNIPPQSPQILTANSTVVVTTAPPPPYQHPPATTLAPINVPMPYTVGPYSFTVQGIHPHHTHHVGFGTPVHPHTVQLPPPPHVQMYAIAPSQFQYPPPPHSTNQQPYCAPPNQSAPPPPSVGYATAPAGAQFYQGPMVRSVYPMPVQSTRSAQPAPPRQPQHFSPTQMRYLLAVYRVGMLALETAARRFYDDRHQTKYDKQPIGEDVKWLLRISKHLGTHYLHQLCVCAVNSIASPFVLHDVAIEAAQYLGRNNPTLVMQHLRTTLTPLVQKCQQMYIQCMHQKLYHLTSNDYEDFVNVVCAARSAFQLTPEGSAQFKEWLQSIRRSKSCKKDLWAQINSALQANSK